MKIAAAREERSERWRRPLLGGAVAGLTGIGLVCAVVGCGRTELFPAPAGDLRDAVDVTSDRIGDRGRDGAVDAAGGRALDAGPEATAKPTPDAAPDVGRDGAADRAPEVAPETCRRPCSDGQSCQAALLSQPPTWAGPGLDLAALVVADIDRDGRPDLVMASRGSNTVSVALGNGDGSFRVPRSFDTDTGPAALVAADFDGDGWLDVAVACPGAGTVDLLAGRGDGALAPARSTSVGGMPSQLAAGDLDGDGRLDLVTAGGGVESGAHALLGTSTGDFRVVPLQVPGSYLWQLGLGDFDGDGALDLAIANDLPVSDSMPSLSIYAGRGDGTFDFTSGMSQLYRDSDARAFAVVDLNGDGRLDLPTAMSGGLFILLGDGDRTFSVSEVERPATATQVVLPADLDGDGTPDLLALGIEEAVALLGDGAGRFRVAGRFALTPSRTAVAAADVDGDGHVDVVSGSSDPSAITFVFGRGDGTFEANRRFLAGTPESVAIADLDEDGRPDLAVGDDNLSSVDVLRGHGDGTFDDAHSFFTGAGQTRTVAAADLDGDGHLDLVATNFGSAFLGTKDGVSVALGKGDGTFGAARLFAAGNGPRGLLVLDLDRDGRLDVVTTNFYSNDVTVLPGNGDGTLGAARSFAVGSNPAFPAAADLDGDGRIDLAVPGGQDVSVLVGNGDGTFQSARAFPVPGGAPLAVAIADFDGDGRPDLAVASAYNGQTEPGGMSVLAGDGEGTFGAARDLGVGTNLRFVEVIDANRDGKPDLALADADRTYASVLIGRGNGTFEPPVGFAVGAIPSYLASGDINGDGIVDLAVASNYNSSGGSVSVLLGTTQLTCR
jgi:hypothetical protein